MKDTIYREDALDALEWKWAGKAAIDAIKDLPSAQQWISCTERLPDTEGRYLCTQLLSGDPYIMVYSFSLDLYDIDEYDFPNHGAGWYDLDSEYGYCEESNVVAWMPLPEPYNSNLN